MPKVSIKVKLSDAEGLQAEVIHMRGGEPVEETNPTLANDAMQTFDFDDYQDGDSIDVVLGKPEKEEGGEAKAEGGEAN